MPLPHIERGIASITRNTHATHLDLEFIIISLRKASEQYLRSPHRVSWGIRPIDRSTSAI